MNRGATIDHKLAPPAAPETARHWYQMPVEAVLAALKSTSQGLDAHEVQRRLAAVGPNEITEGKRRTPLRMFCDQFTDFMILVLLAAAVISGLIGEAKDTIAIVVIVALNAVIGFIQEYRADRAMEALKAMAAPTATVMRDSGIAPVPAAALVPGDVVWLEAGNIVPADLRLLDSSHLRVDESALTGESIPVEKSTTPTPDAIPPLGDRRNMAYKGTMVTYSHARGVVVASGMATEFGKIAVLLQQADDVKTPLQRRLSHFGQRMAIAALVICAAVFALGILRGEAPLLMFLTAVSLAVAAILKALPAVVTIALALGARSMVRHNALVRRLPAVETLGSVTYICTDKTGTLTMNRMQVEAWYCDGSVEQHPGGGVTWDEMLRAVALCSDARADDMGTVVGDPTEVALTIAARQAGLDKLTMERDYPRVAEIPFDSDRKCMTTVHKDPEGGFLAVTKGAVEVILARATHIATSSRMSHFDPAQLLIINDHIATDGLRVLAITMRHWSLLPEDITAEVVERELVLLGFVGLMDPPREEARQAVAQCKDAAIVPVMITGDLPLTARAIAQRLGIQDQGDSVLTGAELGRLSAEELRARVDQIRVYVRVAPEQKLKIVTALQERGELVAMTGDGVNDAPALKRADIGVAMEVAGTDVAKEASAILLLDDNFATIVRAVREGRRIYDNIRRFVRYAVTTNSGEIWTMFLAPLCGLPIPLLPIQILWINLVTDGLPGLALTAEPEESIIMRRPPRPSQRMPFAEARQLVTHPVACIDCHDAASMELRVTRPGFIEGMRTLKAAQGIYDYDVNKLATHQEMRTYVCGQCHVEYYFQGTEKRLVYPWAKGLKVEDILGYYDGIGFKDWTHAESGAPVLKAQHPEFELWNQGIHARSRVACADCHMPYKREGAVKISDHHVRSPLLNINLACQTCHRWPETELKARIGTIQERTFALRNLAMDALVELINDLKAARATGMSEAEMARAQDFQRRAQFFLDFVEAENSMGFHAPQEAARILGESINFSRQGQVAVRDRSRQ